MKIIQKEHFIVIILGFFVIFLLQTPILQALEFDLTAAQNAVGKRFASKFCEAKEKGFSSEASSEFALNNTYLKFVDFPDDYKFIEDLWEFTLEKIRNLELVCNEGKYYMDYIKQEIKFISYTGDVQDVFVKKKEPLYEELRHFKRFIEGKESTGCSVFDAVNALIEVT